MPPGGNCHEALAWDAQVLDDPRVVSVWDGSRIAGRWFADHSIGGLGAPGDIVWDAYFAFGRNSYYWRSEPSRLVASGSDIIDNTGKLEQHVIPLLAAPS